MSSNQNDLVNSMSSIDTRSLSFNTQSQTTPFFYNAIKGCVIGGVEAGIIHPLWQFKNRLQNNDHFTTNLKVLYRGFGINVVSTIPLTAIQVTSTAMLENFRRSITKQNLHLNSGQFQNVSNAFMGGAISSLVSTPVEILMSHKNETETYQKIARSIYRYGFTRFYSGLFAMAMRDGIYTAGYIGGPNLIENQIKSYLPQYTSSAAMVSGPISGIFSAFLSHPFDTIKARQQRIALEMKSNFLSVGKKIIQAEGFLALYKGFIPRAMMVTASISILDKSSKEFDRILQKFNK